MWAFLSFRLVRVVISLLWFIICLLCLFGHLSFLQSSDINLKKRILSQNILLIQYLCTNQILLSNPFNSFQKFPLKLFYNLFSEIIQLIQIQIYISLLTKKSNWLVDLVFEICLDRFRKLSHYSSMTGGNRGRWKSQMIGQICFRQMKFGKNLQFWGQKSANKDVGLQPKAPGKNLP